MRKELLFGAVMLAAAPFCRAQQPVTDPAKSANAGDAAFTFTESQLGEDDDVTQNVIMVSSNSNIYTSNVGYLFSPMRFKYRAYHSRYSDMYFNGVNVNNGETGQFNFSTIGGMNDATRGVEAATPFESTNFAIPGLGGANNYDFRAANFRTGSKATLSGCNRNYIARGMFTHATGLNENGWAFMGTVGYRWGKDGFAEGTFYNSLSYFLAVQKVFNDNHSLSLSTWGNAAERSQQGASTDEAYWLANDRYYNPYWGYQNGKKRNSRVVENYEPTALLTWDWKINDKAKLTTSLIGRYAMYSSTKLNYNGSSNPAPDYWKNMPSYNYNVWDPSDAENTADALSAWRNSYSFWTASKANRQINWDNLYFANRQMNAVGSDAAYYIQAKHNDHLMINLGSTLNWDFNKESKLLAGLQLATNKGMHYQTMEDMLGAKHFHNINNYAIGNFAASDPRVQYDLNHPNQVIGEGDRFGYDYDLHVHKANLWTKYVYAADGGRAFVSGRIGGTQMWRHGHMRHGLYQHNSYGAGDKAYFLDGGFKAGATVNLGYGHALTMGVGLEARAPQANTAFVSPELNNDFVTNLRNETITSLELGYAVNTKWFRANLTGYYAGTRNGNEWQNFYFDDENSFTYVSLSDVKKEYYGVELGLLFKLTSNLSITMLGALNEAKYVENTPVTYLLSTLEEAPKQDICYNKGMRESGTPLTTASIGVDYKIKGWYLSVNGNWYDRIYLSYSPCMRYGETLTRSGAINNDGSYNVPEQAEGEGGFMLDASIGRSFRIGKSQQLGVNLMLTNVLNNTSLVSGGYEQSRSNYTVSSDGSTNARTYKFSNNPKKYYAQGFNGMLNLTYRF